MIKINNIRLIILIITLFLKGFSPITVFAHPEDELLKSYCTRLLIFEVENKKKVADIENAYNTKEKSRLNELTSIRTELDKEFSISKTDLTTDLQQYFDSLASQTKDIAILADIEAFKVQMIALTNTHNEQILQIVLDYREAINEGMVNRKAVFMNSKQNFKDEVSKILNKSKVDCKNIANVQDIFTYTTINLKAVQEVFKNKIANLPNSATLKKSNDKRDNAWKLSKEQYRNSVTNALTIFKANISLKNK